VLTGALWRIYPVGLDRPTQGLPLHLASTSCIFDVVLYRPVMEIEIDSTHFDMSVGCGTIPCVPELRQARLRSPNN
jgi:hypothetical protein